MTLVVVLSMLIAPAAHAAGRPDVAALQVGLRSAGLYGGTVDGLLGPQTVTAIRQLEQRSGLAPTGRMRSELRSALGPYGVPKLGTRSLTVPSVGWDVAEFQFVLASRGVPSGEFDGRFSERTAAAVRRFQRSIGLAPDGVVGPRTLAAARRPAPQVPLPLAPPLDVPMTGGFGPRDARFHTGVDFAAPTGTPVRAAASGTVTFAGWHPGGWGYLVTIKHGKGLRSMSAHLSHVDVTVGQRVALGTQIGTVGSTGNSGGPHLHFELRLKDAAVDPTRTLSASR